MITAELYGVIVGSSCVILGAFIAYIGQKYKKCPEIISDVSMAGMFLLGIGILILAVVGLNVGVNLPSVFDK